MAQQLIDSLSSDFEPDKYHDEYRERVLDLIERKAAGEEIAVQPQAEEPAAAPDLMAALEASLAAVGEDVRGDQAQVQEALGSSDGAASKKQTGQGQELTRGRRRLGAPTALIGSPGERRW